MNLFVIREIVTRGCTIKYVMIMADYISSDNLLIQILQTAEFLWPILFFHFVLVFSLVLVGRCIF